MNLQILRPVQCPDLFRLGREFDGGYVVSPAMIDRAAGVLSFGINTDWSLEESLIARRDDLFIHCYDHTISAGKFLEAAVLGVGRAVIRRWPSELKKFGVWWRYRKFFGRRVLHFAEKVGHRAGPGEADIDTIFRRARESAEAAGEADGEGPRFLVKMDIEGSEYRVLPDLLRHADSITALLIEFHEVDILGPEFDRHIAAINEHFGIVHVHGNNFSDLDKDGHPTAFELSFLHRSLLPEGAAPTTRSYPVEGLDRPNNPHLPDLELPFD